MSGGTIDILPFSVLPENCTTTLATTTTLTPAKRAHAVFLASDSGDQQLKDADA